MTHRTFEAILQQGETLYYTNVGDSMLPLIREGVTLLEIAPKPNRRLNKGEVPLYKRDSGQYVLHRIVKVRPHDYLIRGDNRFGTEAGITDQHIIGVLTAVIQGKERLAVTDFTYKAYLWRLRLTYPFRYLTNLFKRLYKKCYDNQNH